MIKSSSYDSIKYVVFISQLGLMIIVPIIICTVIAILIKDKFDLGNWAVIAGIVLGMLSAGYNFAMFMKFAQRKAKEGQDKRGENDGHCQK